MTTRTTFDQRRHLESLAGKELAAHQLARLNRLLQEILSTNEFYGEKLAGVEIPLPSLDQLTELPHTFKDELVSLQQAGHASRQLTYDPQLYVRYHQTSGTHGRPLQVLDTAADWQWWNDCWQFVLDSAGLDGRDRVMMAFSFGPFIGFWTAADAALARGCMLIPGGGMNTLGRLELMRSTKATALFCTPSYALHMAEVAAEQHVSIATMPVRSIIVAGEPGGSIPAVRSRIEELWGAKVTDHSGATEVGAWGYGDTEGKGLHIVESEFIAEFLSVESGVAAREGELSELVLTPLGRFGSPVIRYRTGDLVRPSWERRGENRFVFLEGGVLGRADDMMIVRGVNVFPSSIEQILRSFPEVVEYRITARRKAELDQLFIEAEDRLDQPQRIAAELKLRLGLRMDVESVPLGSLPRFEGKGKRFVDRRK